MNQKRYFILFTNISFLLLFLISFLTFIPINSKVSAGGPCTCNIGTMKCGGCSPQINDLPCGTNQQVCENAEKRWSCEHTLPFTSNNPSDPIFGGTARYLCSMDPNNPYPGTNNIALKGSWSEVFKTCFCSTGQLIQKIIDIAIYSISGIALIVLALGAIKYITAQNNPDKITEAKETILAGVVGLVLVLFSIAIINLFQGQLPSSWGINFLNIP